MYHQLCIDQSINFWVAVCLFYHVHLIAVSFPYAERQGRRTTSSRYPRSLELLATAISIVMKIQITTTVHVLPDQACLKFQSSTASKNSAVTRTSYPDEIKDSNENPRAVLLIRPGEGQYGRRSSSDMHHFTVWCPRRGTLPEQASNMVWPCELW